MSKEIDKIEEESNIHELLKLAHYYKNPGLITRLLNNKNTLLEKSYDYYTQIINILDYKKEYQKIVDIYYELMPIIIELNKGFNFIGEEYYKYAEYKYQINKKNSLLTYLCAYEFFIKNNNLQDTKKVLNKIINISEDIKDAKILIKFLDIYVTKYNEIDYIIKLGDLYILNDEIIKGQNIYDKGYKIDNNKECFIKLFLCKLFLKEDNIINLYPPFELIDEILYIENIIKFIQNKDIKNLESLENNKDNIINILINLIKISIK